MRAPPATNPYRNLKDCFLRMYALTDYACFEAISSLPLSGDMLPSALMSKMLALLPADHQACFFLCGALLKHLPSDVRAHLVHDRTSDPLSLALHANEIYQSPVSSASAAPDECCCLRSSYLPSPFLVFPYTWSLPLPFSDSFFDLTPFRLALLVLVSPE